ncbi:MAG: DedA family protein [Terriglobia bacterium]|jgi:membrane protein DedA with SNARE-associated domain
MVSALLEILARFITSFISATGYLGIVLLMGIESACIPLPSEIIMPFSGYLVFTGRFNLLGVALAGAVGCNLGSLVAYYLGSWGGRPLVEKFGRYVLITRHDLEMADRFFARYGDWAVFIARLLPVIRTFIALPAGIARMNVLRFHLFTFLGSLPWCYVLAYTGFKLGEKWPSLRGYFHQFDTVIGIVIVLAAAWFVHNRWKNRLRAGNADHSGPPLTRG